MSTRTGWIPLLVCCLAVTAYALQRDLRYEKTFTSDLRNRVVGERLIKDGRSPYFYKWKNGDPIRYYDPVNFDSLKAAIITASPFMHHLLSPMVELPESQISLLWLALEYILLIGTTVLSLFLAKTRLQKMAIVLVFLLFLLTNAWKMHISLGQNYILIPFLAMLFFYCSRKKDHPGWAIAAGVAAACLVLIKMTTILFFIPFLFLARNYPLSWLLAFFLPVLLLAGWTLGDRQERGLWQDYGRLVSETTRKSQGDPTVQVNAPDPHFPLWEGIDMRAAATIEKNEPVKIYSENGNVFVLFQLVFHRKAPLVFLGLAAAGIIGVLLLAFYFLNRPIRSQDLARTAIFGFCLYMVSDLFSPIHRHQYYTIQWLFPLLIAAGVFRSNGRKWPYILALTGILMNCIHLPFIKMGNTIGEYLILASLLAISALPQRLSAPEPSQESAPVSLS